MKHVEVVAAVIQGSSGFLATQRGYGEYEGYWEFPGGKIEDSESESDALAREIKEELGADIEITRKLVTVEYDYASFHLTMHCYLARFISREFELREHMDARWVDGLDVRGLNWLPADELAIDELERQGLFVERG